MNAIPPDRTLDTVTPSEWNQATRAERERLIIQARANGVVAFCCLSCGFPLARGGDRCPACHSTPSITPKQMDAIRSWGAMTNCPMCGTIVKDERVAPSTFKIRRVETVGDKVRKFFGR